MDMDMDVDQTYRLAKGSWTMGGFRKWPSRCNDLPPTTYTLSCGMAGDISMQWSSFRVDLGVQAGQT